MPPINNVDLSLLKRLNVTEGTRFEIGAQAFNLLNHAQYTGSWLNDVSPNPTLTTTRNELIPRNAKFRAVVPVLRQQLAHASAGGAICVLACNGGSGW